MRYDSPDTTVERRLGNAQVVYSDVDIALRSDIGPELWLSRVEWTRLVEEAPEWWFDGVDRDISTHD